MKWFFENRKNLRRAFMQNAHVFTSTGPGMISIATGMVVASVLFIGVLSKSNETLLKTPTSATDINAVDSVTENLTDFRLLDEQGTVSATTLETILKPGSSLGPILQKNGVKPNVAYAATQAFSKAYDPRVLRAGQKINLYFENNAFSGMSLKPNAEQSVFVNRTPDGDFRVRKVAAEYDKQLVSVRSRIENNLYLDAKRLGASDKVIAQFVQIYAHSVDFQRDIREGDRFELVFELYRDHQGNPVKAGDLVFTSFSPRGKTTNYYLFEKPDGKEGYYDEKGKGAKRMLMRTPVNGARLSSRYGNRKHPILGYRTKHKGVDFAAPTGASIMAAGTGTIERASHYGSYGKYIRIRHPDGYKTAYAHLSKYARGIKSGARVIQGQTIGYVGATGRATGAHLHYEVHKNGKQINPMTLSTLSGKPLKKDELPAFKQHMAEIEGLRETVASALQTKPELTTGMVTLP